MTTGGSSCSIDINNMLVEVVSSFPYLGSLITDDTECTKDIRGRLTKGLGIGAKLKKIWQNHGIRISTKICLMKAWPVAMYGCESWTFKKDDEKRISAFEMKYLRQVLRVSWLARRTNEWVLETAGVSRSLLASVKEMKLAYYGHILGKKGDCLEKELIQGTSPVSRTRGRPKMTWIDNIKSWSGLSLTELTRKAEDRHQWRKIVHGVANPRNEDG